MRPRNWGGRKRLGRAHEGARGTRSRTASAVASVVIAATAAVAGRAPPVHGNSRLQKREAIVFTFQLAQNEKYGPVCTDIEMTTTLDFA